MSTKQIKIGLYGSAGKMGKSVEQIILNETSAQAKASVSAEYTLHPYLAIGKTTSDVFSITADNLENVEAEVLEDIDVWIDFSSAEGLTNLLVKTESQKTPIVSGSTGLTDKDFLNLKKQSTRRPLFWASNLSPGLWAFRQALKSLSSIANFDFAIEEIHHTQKKDRPSGTAKTLHSDLEKIVGKKIEEPTSYRLGGIFGVHTLLAASSNEMITMQHQALNRTVFAEGAMLAAKWLFKKKQNGLYSMDDLFKVE